MKNYIYNLLLLFGILSYSQQDSQFTQYMYNTINVNPAYAGTRETFSAFVLHRNQWVGLNGAPITNTASINTNVGDSKFGVGLLLLMIILDQHKKMLFQQMFLTLYH